MKNGDSEDKRPDPKPRKNAHLWQAYLWWDELMQMRKRHLLRISSADAGKSYMDAQFERDMMGGGIVQGLVLDRMVDDAKKVMIAAGEMAEPAMWAWLTAIKGLKEGSLAAQLLAQLDDPGKYATVSRMWRFAGWATYPYWMKDGKIMAPKDGWQFRNGNAGDFQVYGQLCEPDMPGAKPVVPGQQYRGFVITVPEPGWTLEQHIDVAVSGWVCPYNKRLKSTCWLIIDQFIKQQTPGYVDLYYEEKERLHKTLPPKQKTNGGKWQFNDGHIANRAIRKTAKIFLQHVWVTWREAAGLTVSEPYVQAVLGHTHIVQPANL